MLRAPASEPDRSIPFYNTIMRCDGYAVSNVLLPEGYSIVSYREGYERAWARLECSIGDFESETEAADYFVSHYLNRGTDDRLLFLLNAGGEVIGSCLAWYDERHGVPVNSLHWLVVEVAYRGRGLGRALCKATMNRFAVLNGEPIYIHTQPWSYPAIMLYVSLGFRLQKSDSFAAYVNQYGDAMRALKGVLSAEQYGLLEERMDE